MNDIKHVDSELSCSNRKDRKCENFIFLACKHPFCKACFDKNLEKSEQIECNFCKNKTRVSRMEKQDLENLKKMFDFNITGLFKHIADEFEKKLEIFENIELNLHATFENQIQFVREEIEIRIESLKLELDELNGKFNRRLDDITVTFKNAFDDASEKYDKESFRKHLQELKQNISNTETLVDKNFYFYQNFVKSVNEGIKRIEAIKPSVHLDVSKLSLEENLIGSVTYDLGMDFYQNNEIIDRTMDSKHTIKHLLSNQISDFCRLPNGKLLFCDESRSCMYLYDENIEFVRAITNQSFRSVDCNQNGDVFLLSDHNLVKMDLEFNELASLEMEYGYKVRCDKDLVYICNRSFKCIDSYSKNLELIKSYNLAYHPISMETSGNVICVRSVEGSIYFYDIKDFTEIRKYDTHCGFIGTFARFFYEYDYKKKILYCYDNTGSIVNSIKTVDYGFVSSALGRICVNKSRLVMFNNQTGYLVLI